MIRLAVIRDGRRDERIFSGDDVLVGRSRSCDLVLEGVRTVSRRHCRLRRIDGRCEVEDLSSATGVQINGIHFSRGIAAVGDEIRLGGVRLEMLELAPDVAAERVRPCLKCGALVPFEAAHCVRCAEGVRPAIRRRVLTPEHIPGYRLVRKIGSGGMGLVFEALRLEDERTVAIKILKPHLARHPAYLVRFVEETRVLTLLRHPNIVAIYGRGSDAGLTFIEMELVRGDSVRGMIRRQGRLAEDTTLRLVWDAVLALDHAARQRVIHADVKPSNFLIDEHGTLKVCDFGLARFMDFAGPAGRGAAPEISGRRGTAAYAAPERFLSRARPTLVGDIYSLGVGLYQMITGELPFRGRRLADQTSEPAPDPRELVPALRPAIGMLIRRMTEPDPGRRFPDYRALQDDLALLLD